MGIHSVTGGADASAKRVIVMSSGQEELRAELTKRGVPFKSYSVKLYDVTMEVGTVYSGNGIDWVAIENPDTHRISVSNFKDELTPAQAIAATLGSGTCKLVETEHEQEIADEFGKGTFSYWAYDCSECGYENAQCGRFCAGCGRKVVDA